MTTLNNYLKYGVSIDEANHFDGLGIPISTFKNTSNKNLISKYGLKLEQVKRIKKLISRQPIEDETLKLLLGKSNYTCNVCHGIKGKSYILHHIEQYSISQDNRYHNLIVLCPTCHDLAHRPGGLTSNLTEGDLIITKEKWEKQVEKQDAEAASRNGETSDIDYINIPRIAELALNILHTIPDTSCSYYLQDKGILDASGNFDMSIVDNFPSDRAFPLHFGKSFYVKHHYMEIFKEILNRVNFYNLDDLLNIKSVKTNSLVGTYCYYIGGIYGKSPKIPITDETPTVSLWFKRRCFYVEWIIDPRFMASMTSIMRLSQHTVYLVYGKIRNISERTYKGKDYIHFDVRPYVLSLPEKTIDRRPPIHWIKKYEDFEDEIIDETMN
ncbi:MAG: HNH endonuclease [Desulfobulbaceae bacterium]|nr:HNH endonuclease [Desulfobulbaceae bacterium]